jgi:hypothetical protein
MKKLILSLSCAASLAIQCELPEKIRSFYTIPASLKATFRRFDKQAEHPFVIGNTLVWSCVAAAAGSTVIPAIGVGVIAMRSVLMHQNKKLAEQQKLLETEMARHTSAAINAPPAKIPTAVIEKGASQLP